MVPSVPTLVRICQALKISSDELLGLANEDGTLKVTETAGENAERPELRPVIRVMRTLDSSHIKLLGRVASALKKE